MLKEFMKSQIFISNVTTIRAKHTRTHRINIIAQSLVAQVPSKQEIATFRLATTNCPS